MKHTLAIAGCCGYIGTHMTRAALDLGLKVCGIDPLLKASDWKQHPGFEAVETVEAFCDLDADRYYLALQPDHRAPYLDRLIRDGRPIFSEKPMSRARDPEQCLKLVADLADSDATIGYNFLLIFNPITEKILAFFRRHQSVRLRYMRSLFEKNRESRRNDRNLIFMEPIQYQESID